MRELVSGLRERFAETYAKVRDVAEVLRGADFSALKETNDLVKEQEREQTREKDQDRIIDRLRDRGFERGDFER